MFVSTLFEREKRSDIQHRTKFSTVYHLMDSSGMTNAINANSLNAFRQDYISTTTNPKVNGIHGRNHYNFKLILDAQKLAKTYGVFTVVDYVTSIGNNGSRKQALKEFELGIATKAIAPLADFSLGLIYMRPINSRAFMQDLFYRNYNNQGWGILALSRWKSLDMPVYVMVQEGHRPLSSEEDAILEYAMSIARRYPKITYPKALQMMASKFNILDHDGGPIEPDQIKRETKSSSAMNRINAALTKVPWSKLDPAKIKTVISKVIDMMGYGGNYKAELMHQLESRELFDPQVAPVQWSIFVRDIIKNVPLEELVASLEDTKKERDKTRDAFKDSKWFGKSAHPKSRVAGVGDGF
jgi:hypothetical protein